MLGCQRRLHDALRVQVPNNHILTPNLYYNYYYPNPKYLIIGYMDPLGCLFWASWTLELDKSVSDFGFLGVSSAAGTLGVYRGFRVEWL